MWTIDERGRMVKDDQSQFAMELFGLGELGKKKGFMKKVRRAVRTVATFMPVTAPLMAYKAQQEAKKRQIKMRGERAMAEALSQQTFRQPDEGGDYGAIPSDPGYGSVETPLETVSTTSAGAAPPVSARAAAPSPAPMIEPSPDVVEYERAPAKQYMEVPSPEEAASEYAGPESSVDIENGVGGYIVTKASPAERIFEQRRTWTAAMRRRRARPFGGRMIVGSEVPRGRQWDDALRGH